jgi:proteasome accessory factor B
LSDRVERTERLLNLVICLMDSAVAVPRADIQRRIPGYATAASPSAFERMFERDKDELRSMGIPVETVADPHGEVLGYRIPIDRYALGELDLSIEERAAVAVAAQVWGQAVVAPVAGTALRKLETVASDPDGWTPADLRGSVQLTVSDAALLPLMAAVRQDRTVSFPYRPPTESEPMRRTVSPWGLRSSAGHWFLVGFDHDRGAERTYRLSRITGPVLITGRAREVQPPESFDISAYAIGPQPDDGGVRATVRLSPGRGASVRRRAVAQVGVDPWSEDSLSVEGYSLDDLVGVLCAAGPDVTVLGPPEVAAAVTAALSALLDAHTGGTA